VSGLAFEFSEQLLDELAAAVAQRLEERARAVPEDTGYLDVAAAAEFLSCPRSRVYALVSADRIPHHRDGSRLLFVASELHTYVTNGGARRP